ncbi:uncharacterized protein BYT42DRAFT_564109 [Radiomyces spectabilis]|uniref:uncharacterized protein n=1 Tax=Radiomyces spectabilis TaxID=64574 RepID=UPI00221F3759|nr:uncharacterized protein BYT42DRAFT_564109 [Radiomyces spectabilis]KAI8384927.1 hypothetical protein BYT42DRAFT_564109 [Radiomyces spectabilis]
MVRTKKTARLQTMINGLRSSEDIKNGLIEASNASPRSLSSPQASSRGSTASTTSGDANKRPECPDNSHSTHTLVSYPVVEGHYGGVLDSLNIMHRFSFLPSPFALSPHYDQLLKMERERKWIKIRAVCHDVTEEEMHLMLTDCQENEDEVMLRLITQADYLANIRRLINSQQNHTAKKQETAARPLVLSAPKPLPDLILPAPPTQKVEPLSPPTPVPQALEKKIQFTPIQPKIVPSTVTAQPLTEASPVPTTIEKPAKKDKRWNRMNGRLALDDALKQAEEKSNFEGWSQARIRAYQMIDQNPNSYYYRFNAPGEEQRKGQWSEEEKRLFFDRLKEVGANSQWGIFSMAIPGRVGYQCSNFYRLLIETQQIHDPNYVLDEKGKAHYLFDKKTADGQVEKIFRKHSKHGSHKPTDNADKRKPKKRKRRYDTDEDSSGEDEDDKEYKNYNVSRRITRQTAQP